MTETTLSENLLYDDSFMVLIQVSVALVRL